MNSPNTGGTTVLVPLATFLKWAIVDQIPGPPALDNLETDYERVAGLRTSDIILNYGRLLTMLIVGFRVTANGKQSPSNTNFYRFMVFITWWIFVTRWIIGPSITYQILEVTG